MAVPIWKDYFVTLGSADSYKYRILLADTEEVIYSGKAFKRPGDTNVSVRINDICADHFRNALPALYQAQFTRFNSFEFEIQMYINSTWASLGYVQFLNDWSYEYGYNAATMGMSFPINGHIDSRMPIMWTGYNVSQVVATTYYKNGTTEEEFITIGSTPKSGTAVFFVQGNNAEKVVIGNSTFKVVTECAKYALYYVNAYGGWDSLLIEGNDLESDSLKRYTREMEYNNTNINNKGIENYVNEVTKRFTLHTGLLSDDEASRMHHLINSTDVYLYDIVEEQMIPVLITDNSVDYKTYHNQGNQMVTYTIQVEVAQNRIRR